MTNKLTSLRKLTTVVADTGDIAAMKLYQPQDATTNPSLILNAAQIPEYRKLIDEAIEWARSQSNSREQQIVDACDKLAVNIGLEILKLILAVSRQKWMHVCLMILKHVSKKRVI